MYTLLYFRPVYHNPIKKTILLFNYISNLDNHVKPEYSRLLIRYLYRQYLPYNNRIKYIMLIPAFPVTVPAVLIFYFCSIFCNSSFSISFIDFFGVGKFSGMVPPNFCMVSLTALPTLWCVSHAAFSPLIF